MAFETPTSALPEVASVRRIEDLTHDDIPCAGGKGANLGELTRGGRTGVGDG